MVAPLGVLQHGHHPRPPLAVDAFNTTTSPGRRCRSHHGPRVDQIQLHVDEIASVSRRDRQAVGARDCRDLAVGRRYSSPRRTAHCRNVAIVAPPHRCRKTAPCPRRLPAASPRYPKIACRGADPLAGWPHRSEVRLRRPPRRTVPPQVDQRSTPRRRGRATFASVRRRRLYPAGSWTSPYLKDGGSSAISRGGNSRSTPPRRPEVSADDAREVPGLRGATDCIAQDQASFLFHGPAGAGGPHTQAGLHLVVEIADRDARHGRAFQLSKRQPTRRLRCNQATLPGRRWLSYSWAPLAPPNASPMLGVWPQPPPPQESAP